MSDCWGYIFLTLVVIIFVIFGLTAVRTKERFSPTGWTQNCPPANPRPLSPKMAYGPPWRDSKVIDVDGDYIAGSVSPGSVFKCNGGNCPALGPSCGTVGDVPQLRENLPLGWGSTMTGPYADNWSMSGVNGINKPTLENPYGKVYPHGKQMYGFIEKGSNNCFDA